MDGKYAPSPEVGDPGFGHTALSEFRTRVVEHDLEKRVLACCWCVSPNV